MSRVNLGHYVLGMEGLALLRTYTSANTDKALERVTEMRTFVNSPDLLPPLQELARVVRPGGYLLLSDFHPFMVVLGETAFFVAADGSAGHVTTYWHPHSAYLHAFQQTGLIVERCIEPTFGEQEIEIMSSGMLRMAKEAFRSALLGVPGALVWLLRRPPSP